MKWNELHSWNDEQVFYLKRIFHLITIFIDLRFMCYIIHDIWLYSFRTFYVWLNVKLKNNSKRNAASKEWFCVVITTEQILE